MTTLEPFLNRVIHGDCIDVMKTMPDESVDFVLADPPYLVKYKCPNGRRAYPNDDSPWWLNPAFAQIYRVLKPNRFFLCFYGWPKADHFLRAWRSAGFYPVSHMVWVKRYSSRVGFTRSCHESAYLLAKGNPLKSQSPPKDVLPWHWAGNTLHPAQKPVMVLSPVIQAFSKPGDVVLDPFAGSGTTGIAATQCGRRFVIIEKVWRYFKTAEKRIQESCSRPPPLQVRNPLLIHCGQFAPKPPSEMKGTS